MTILLAAAAFLLLAAGTHRQSRILLGHPPSTRSRRVCLAGGYALILLSLGLNLAGPDARRQIVEWFGDLTFAALCVVIGTWLLTAWRERRMKIQPRRRRNSTPPVRQA